jgi:NDP-sugar pyrophosphorylase family protein
MLNIVIPMAGLGSRFSDEGYKDPKPLISIHGVPMIKLVIDNLTPKCDHRFIFICQRKHVKEYELKRLFNAWAPNNEVIELDGITEGAACTVYSAKPLINNNDPVMIANSDQYVDVVIDDYLSTMDGRSLDGLIMTMKADDPKWSFVGLDSEGLVDRVVEKEVISDEATVGIYNFRSGMQLVAAIESMFKKGLRVNGEYYVAPAYNEMINIGLKVGFYNVGEVGAGMYGLGIPDDLSCFLDLPISRKITKL